MEARSSSKRTAGMHTRVRDRQTKIRDLPVLPGPSTFSEVSVPAVLWPDLLEEYGIDYTFHTAEGEDIAARGIWFDGVVDESVFPGRYSRLWVDTRDLPRDPRSADWVVIDGDQYDVERVADTRFGILLLVLKLTGPPCR